MTFYVAFLLNFVFVLFFLFSFFETKDLGGMKLMKGVRLEQMDVHVCMIEEKVSIFK
jgi:hypothetical protein